MIPEREREALMRLTMCAREECIMCKYHKECDFDFQYETATRCMNILADALRKTESNSENPNNCEDLQDWKDRMWAEAIVTEPQPTTDCRQTDCYMCKWLGEVDVCGRCRNRNLFAEADTEPKPKDEPTSSKMEQVDKDINVRSKDEPQFTPNYCGTCKHREVPCGNLPCDVCHGYSNYEPKDEPQRETKMETQNSNLTFEKADEPQTDCPWK